MIVFSDTQIFFTQRAGGASVYWYELYRRMLEDERIELHLFVADGEYDNVFMNQLDLSSAVIHRERFTTNNQLRLHGPKIPAVAAGNAVFHSSYMRLPSRSPIKKVVTVHDFTHQKFFPPRQAIPNTLLKKRAIQNADGIVTISSSTYKDMVNFYPKAKDKLNAIIYNGASEDYHVGEDAGGCRPEVVKAASHPFVLYVGARSGYKNFRSLIEAMAGNDAFSMVVVGGESGSVENASKEIIRLESVSNKELNYLYNKAHCLVYPSLYEGFGIPVLEAMKAGCPVIAFNNSSIPEVLSGSGILLENNDIDGMKSAISSLIDQKLRTLIVDKQLEAARSFSWNRAYQDLISFYERVLAV